jgi:hypothetical protein
MSDNQYDDGGREADEARDRINRILRGGGSGAEQPPVGDMDDPLGDSEALSRARARVRSSRADLGAEEPAEDPFAASRARTPGRSNQALIVIGGVVGVGVLLVLALVVVVPLLTGGGVPFLSTATPTPTITPTPTATATPTATPTKTAPSTLSLPNLTCIYLSDTGCLDYCGDEANKDECQGAKDFVSAQGADPDVWLQCVAPAAGPNVGEPLECLRDAWRANNP